MENIRPIRRAWLPLVFTCVTIGLMVANRAEAQTSSSSGWWPFNHPTPPPAPAAPADDDPLAIAHKSKVGVELYVAIANLYVQTGKYAEAEDQYQKAMKLAPDDIRVLLGYAILKDQMSQPDEAMKFYQKAKEKHPDQPSVYNNLAVHCIKHGMVREAIDASRRAVEIRPHEPRYRNNLAALYVEAGMPQEAFKQLREVYEEPIAHYNLGFLLNKRGMKPAALQEFSMALQLSPGMPLARQWIERLSRERGDGNPPAMGMMPPRDPAPATFNANANYAPAAAPLAPPPPQYAAPQQYMTQAPPAEPPYQVPAQPPVQVQYPAQAPYAALPPNPPQGYAVAQNPGPQYQNAAPSPGTPPTPLVAFRDPPTTGVRVIPGTDADGNALRRLPDVSDPRYPANPNRAPQGSEVVAPDSPNYQR